MQVALNETICITTRTYDTTLGVHTDDRVHICRHQVQGGIVLGIVWTIQRLESLTVDY